jgi:hypothetical protein
MIQWLYRYVFRGIGILFLIGMLTILFLAINSQIHKGERPHERPSGARP